VLSRRNIFEPVALRFPQLPNEALKEAYYVDVLYTVRVASRRAVQILPRVRTSPRSIAFKSCGSDAGSTFLLAPPTPAESGGGNILNAHKIREAVERPSLKSSGRKRDGCVLLSNDKASAIWGLEVERLDGRPSNPESGEHDEYFVKQAAAAISNDSKSDATQLPSGSVYMLQSVNRGGIGAPCFAFTVERENGKIACTAFSIANRLGNDDMATGGCSEPLSASDPSNCGHSRFQAVCGAKQLRPDSLSLPGDRGKSQRNRVLQDSSSPTVVRLSKGQTK
jgi:hypothetical protein